MTDAASKFLETLSNSFGPPGFETDPLRAVKTYAEEFADTIRHLTERGEYGGALHALQTVGGNESLGVVFLPQEGQRLTGSKCGFAPRGILDVLLGG